MKKSEKTELTKEKIFSASLVEFGTKGYKTATLNSICANHKISKGLIYHNFKNKDEIYLLCIEYSFDSFMNYMQRHYDENSGLSGYLKLQFDFFAENRILARIFFEALLQPPAHLGWDIKALKSNLYKYIVGIYRREIGKMQLRDNVSEEDAVEYCKMINEMFNGYFTTGAYDGGMFFGSGEEGSSLSRMLDFMLYGIAKTKTANINTDTIDDE